jgi:hypothetical protein
MMTIAKKFGEMRNADTGEVVAELFCPGRSEDAISTGLRILTCALQQHEPAADRDGGFFGGEFGYGVNFENDVFLMHRECWCDKDGECPWCTGCGIYQDQNACDVCRRDDLTVEQRRAAPAEQRCDYSAGRGIFARFAPWTIDHVRHYYDPPNFWHKASNLRVCWYKYIGRDSVTNRTVTDAEWISVLESCLATINLTLEQATAIYAREVGEQ